MHTPILPSGPGQLRALRRWAGRLLALALPLLATFASQAQSITTYTFAASSGTFTPLTGATAAPTTGGTTDDDVTAVLPIGFMFVYNGVAYTTFSASTNGFMGLGGQVSSINTNSLSGATGVRPFIAPLWDDLQLTSASDISYLTTGTAGSRVLTVQWLNEKWNWQGTAAAISFQAKLYEADGHIEFVYRQETGTLNSPSASIGITAVATGSGNFLSLSDATAAPTVSSTAETTTIATKPATGQVYTFTPAGGVVAAPTSLVFSAITTTGGTVTFTDNSTNEYSFAVTITPTAGGAATTTIVPSTTTAGTGTTYSTSFTGLSANTGYTVQVQALGQGRASTAGSGTFTTVAGSTLSGVYYVGTGTSPQPSRTYATLTAAAAAYTTGTLTGPVTFLLLDNAYGAAETFPITFGVNTSASATNTLTIQPNAGVNATITASSTSGAIVLNGADYVIIDGSNTTGGTTRNLTVATTSTTGVAAIQLISLGTGAGATFDVIRNLNIVGPSSSAGVGIVAGGSTLGSTGADNDNLTIQNNNITSCYSGIFVLGTASVSAGGTDALVITGNTLGGATAGTSNLGNVGMLVNSAISPSITLNTVQNISGTTSPTAFSLTGTTGATISQNLVQNVGSSGGNAFGLVLGAGSTGATITRNRLLNIFSTSTGGYGGKGIDVQTGSATSGILIANNFVQITASSGWSSLTSDANVGIRLGTGGTLGGVNVYYNSVNLTGTDIYNTTTVSAALYVGSGTTAVDIRNNVLRNSIVNSANTGAKAYAFYSAAPNTAFTQLNYNDYFVSGSQGVLGYLGADATTLAALQTATGKDANSLNVDPLFVSTTDLHTNAAALNNAATPIAGVTVDIDGDARSATTPDIGADEFTPVGVDIAAAGLVAPAITGTAGACFGTAEGVTVSIRNAGATALNFATTPATITVVITGPTGVATQTLTYTLNTGTLASGATLSVPLTGAGTTANLSTLGTYSFAITATVAGDGNTANNTLTPAPTVTVSAPVPGTLAASATSLCNSGTTALTLTGAANGNIQLQSSTSATGTFTNVAGATSATYTTPVLNSTTYYRAVVSCGTNTVTSNVIGVTVSSPLVASTNTPVTICSGGTATLTATANTGSNVRFFSTATGGTALTSTTPGSYTTPALTANTTYYAEAYTGSQENVGAAAYNSTGQTPQTGGALYFTTTGPTTISNVTVYLNAGQVAGTVTIALRTGSSTAGAVVNNQSTAFPVPAGPTTGLAPYVIPLNFVVPAAGQYTLHLVSATQGGLVRDNAGTNPAGYPYTSPSGLVSITGASVSGYYYYFYNWQIGSECASATRTAIQVNVNPAANASFSYGANSSFCTSQTAAQAVVLGTGATAGTYSSTAGLTINASTGAITPSTSTPGTYTVTNSVAASGTLCAGTATTTVTITAPATAGFGYGTGTVSLCTSQATAVAPTMATGATAGTFSSTAGLTINATTGAITPSTSTPGTYTVTNTVAASGGCAATTATATVTITAAPIATFSYATAAACAGATGLLSPTLGTGATAGTYSSTTGLTINATTGAIDPSTSTAGTYTVTNTVAASGGCAATTATATVTINPVPATPTVTVTYPAAGTALLSSTAAPAGASYQWYLNGVAIAGATGQTYTANGSTAPGAYTLRLIFTATGCQSAATGAVTVTATAQALAGASLRLFPNPTTDGKLTLELNGFRAATQLTVLDALGRVVLTQSVAAGQPLTHLDLSGAATGVYLLRATSEGATMVQRIVRQ